jgi:hypothetical protein
MMLRAPAASLRGHGDRMRNWGVGCSAAILLCGFLVVRACEPGPGASYVRLAYADEPKAPTLTHVRVLWSGENAAYSEVLPGQELGYVMYPTGGGGELTLLFTMNGEEHAWTGHVGQRNSNGRYGVLLQVDPLGTVRETHCSHPCPGSERPWYEPYRTRVRQLIGLD